MVLRFLHSVSSPSTVVDVVPGSSFHRGPLTPRERPGVRPVPPSFTVSGQCFGSVATDSPSTPSVLKGLVKTDEDRRFLFSVPSHARVIRHGNPVHRSRRLPAVPQGSRSSPTDRSRDLWRDMNFGNERLHTLRNLTRKPFSLGLGPPLGSVLTTTPLRSYSCPLIGSSRGCEPLSRGPVVLCFDTSAREVQVPEIKRLTDGKEREREGVAVRSGVREWRGRGKGSGREEGASELRSPRQGHRDPRGEGERTGGSTLAHPHTGLGGGGGGGRSRTGPGTRATTPRRARPRPTSRPTSRTACCPSASRRAVPPTRPRATPRSTPTSRTASAPSPSRRADTHTPTRATPTLRPTS